MQNRKELTQIGHIGLEKQRVVRGGTIIIFGRGEGINIVFGPKYRSPMDRGWMQ